MKEIKNLSKIRLFLGIVITAVAMFIFMPINVFATTDYEIYVNGEQFTSEKTTINCGDGTATFDISTNTLILNNATITKRYGSQYAVINSEISNLTIQLIGNNVIDGNKGEYDGIGAEGGSNVVIVGDGNLTMKDVYYGTYIGDYSVPGGNLKINNTTINIENAQATGIWVNHDLEIINSNIKIDKTGNDLYFGIVSNIGGTITIDGGNLDINTNSHCILLGNGDNSNHNVVIKSGNIKLNSRRNGAYGIKFEPVLNTDTINGNIKIDGGNLEISTIAGGTNIDDSKITINSKLIFLKGTSLKDNGKILLNEAKNYYTVSFAANGGTGSMADATGVSGDYVLPVCGFTAPNGKQFKAWSVGGVEKAVGDKINVAADTTVTAVWKADEYNVTVTDGKATVGVSTDVISKAEVGATVTLTANAAPSGQVFDKWEVVSGSITLDDAKSATTTFPMPAGDVSVKATYKAAPVTLSSIAITTAPAKTTYTAGESFNKTGMVVTATYSNGSTATVTDYTVSPSAALTTSNTSVTISYTEGGVTKTATQVITVNPAAPTSGGIYIPPTYKVESTVSEDADGTVTFSKASAKKGDTVTITVTPDRYYKTSGVIVKDASGRMIAVTDNGNGTFTFQMPDSKVTVEPVFSWDNPFVDVAGDAYYAPAVEWALKNDITNGTSATTFSPNAGCTRGQIVTFLWRAAGCPEPKSSVNPFTDVEEGAYYSKAVLWAVENGITDGTGDGTTFSPDLTCTRDQTVTFLWRAAGKPAVTADKSFADVSADAWYATAVAWAVENGITDGTGDGTTFSPADDCTRAQIVTFLYRFFVK